MTAQEIELAVRKLGYQGEPITCSQEDYPLVRSELHKQAGKWIDTGQDIRAQLALSEVMRLDKLHDPAATNHAPTG
jgi:hypothetical protein